MSRNRLSGMRNLYQSAKANTIRQSEEEKANEEVKRHFAKSNYKLVAGFAVAFLFGLYQFFKEPTVK